MASHANMPDTDTANSSGASKKRSPNRRAIKALTGYDAATARTQLAMPMITSATDSLAIKEVRDGPPGDAHRAAIAWEVTTGLASAVAGAAIVCVRHPDSVAPLRAAIAATWGVC